MGYWSNVCVEGFCFGGGESDGNYPCGKNVPSPFCLGTGRSGICPHFAWSGVKEREVAPFVPFRLILKDKIAIWTQEIKDRLEWWFWGQLWFNRRKIDEFFANIKTVSAEECLALARMEKEERKNEDKFPKWFKESVKE